MNKSHSQSPQILIVCILLPRRNNRKMLNLQTMVNRNHRHSTKNRNSTEAARILRQLRAAAPRQLRRGAPAAAPGMGQLMQQSNMSANCVIVFIFLMRD